jgi:hypothetical protein
LCEQYRFRPRSGVWEGIKSEYLHSSMVVFRLRY